MYRPHSEKERLLRALRRSLAQLEAHRQTYGYFDNDDAAARWQWKRVSKLYPYEAMKIAQEYEEYITLSMENV